MLALHRPPLRVWLWTAGTVALAVVAVFLWSISDARATSSTTAPPGTAVSGSPAPHLSLAWAASGSPLPDQVVESGRVVVGSDHGISARDPATGREVWHYTRSNVRLCGVTAVDGLVITAWAPDRRCNEMVALHADTGVYEWTRNVDFRADVRLTSTAGSVLAVSPTGVVNIDPAGDNIRWRYHAPVGCGLTGAVIGSSGVALVQSCSSANVEVQLLDALGGTARWKRAVPVPAGTTARPVGADGPVTVQVGDRLQILGMKDGALGKTVALPSGTGDAAPAEATAGGALLVWARGALVGLAPDTGAVRWRRAAIGLPGALSAATPGTSSVLVPETGGFVAVDPVTGAVTGRSAVPSLPAGGRTTVVGSTVVYRLPGRVLAYE